MFRHITLMVSILGVACTATAHTGVPSEPSGLHPIYHGETLVGGYTSKGYVSLGPDDSFPVWRRMPSTSGMYVAAYGTPDGRSFALTTAGLWEVKEGGCEYSEAETQFGPMTLVQSAFHPSDNHLSWIGATASNGKPILYFSENGNDWTRVLNLPPGLGWRGLLWDPNQHNGIGVFRERDALRLVNLMPDGTILPQGTLPSELPLEAVLLSTSPDYDTLYFRASGETETGEHLWGCTVAQAQCTLIYDSPDKLFHALWLQGDSTLAWMDETGERRLLTLDGELITEVESVGYFGFLPNLGATDWFLKKMPATHAFSTLNTNGNETGWMAFDEIVVEPCPPKPGEEPDSSNPFDGVPQDTESQSPDDPDSAEASADSPEDPEQDTEEDGSGGGGCQGAAGFAAPMVVLFWAFRRRHRAAA